MILIFFPFMDRETSSEREVYFSRLHSPGPISKARGLTCECVPGFQCPLPWSIQLDVPWVWQKVSPTSIQCPLRSLFSENAIELRFSVRERTACPRLFSSPTPETFHFLHYNDLLPLPYNSTCFRCRQNATTWFFKIHFSECGRITRKLETSGKRKTWESVKNHIKHPNTPNAINIFVHSLPAGAALHFG